MVIENYIYEAMFYNILKPVYKVLLQLFNKLLIMYNSETLAVFFLQISLQSKPVFSTKQSAKGTTPETLEEILEKILTFLFRLV